MTRRGKRLTEEDILIIQERQGTRVRPATPAPAVAAQVFIVIPGEPQAKPRQSQSDKWKTRPEVVRYREWSDRARKCLEAATGRTKVLAGHLDIKAYFEIPKSHKDRNSLMGLPHQVKPDFDNLEKAIADSLILKDQRIHEARIRKRWDDGYGPRVEVTIYS